MRTGIVAAALTVAVLAAGDAGAQATTDVLTIGTVSVSSGTGQVEVPIFIQDNSGTPIGSDKAAGLRITGFGMQVVYAPTGNPCIDTPTLPGQEIDLTGGILAGQFAEVDKRVKVANTSQSWVYSSSEANGLIPFTLNKAAPGDQIGAMVFNLNGCPAGPINLVITASGGSEALLNSDSGTTETVDNGGLTVVNGAINVVLPGESLWTVAPCRVIDTRNPDGPQGGPALAANTVRSFPVANSCGIPPSASAVAVNIAVVAPSDVGDLRVYPAGGAAPLASAINFRPGIVRANNAIVPLGTGGQISVQCDMPSGSTDFILDVYGYFQHFQP